MGKLLVIGEKVEFHRFWNFVVPLHEKGGNSAIQSIPTLTKNSFKKNRRRKIKSAY